MIRRLNPVFPLAIAFVAWCGQATVFAQARPFPQPNDGPKGPRTPNIILIITDDLGYGDLGAYGQKLIKTPNLDRLAAEGLRFTDAYAGAPLDSASRAALMTGQHSGHCFIRGDLDVPLRSTDITVGQVLRTAAYKTIAIGKWGMGLENSTGEPFKKGFEHWVGFVDQAHADNYYPGFLWRFEPGFKGINAYQGMVDIHRNREGRRLEYSQDLLTRSALNAVRIHRPAYDNKYQPFFLYLSYTTPHANADLQRKTGNGMEVPNNLPYDVNRWPMPEKNKAAMITRMDADVGKILAQLREYKMDEETLVIFTSDNGPHAEGGNDPAFFQSAGPFRGIKRSLYEGGMRVPLIARWTGKTKPNSITSHVTASWDFMPTLCQIARVAPPRDVDGISFLPTLIGGPQQQQHEFLYWEFHEGGSKQAVRMGQWKAVRPEPGKALELYDLKSDIAEAKDVAADNPDVVVKLENFLRTARTKSDNWPITMPDKRSAQK